MALPRDFSEDGAAGAGGHGLSGSPGAAGTQTGGTSVTDAGPAPAAAPHSGGGGGGLETGTIPQYNPNAAAGQAGSLVNRDTTYSGGGGAPVASRPLTSAAFDTLTGGGPGFSFARGGVVPEDIDGSPEQNAIHSALSTVDEVLAFGRKLHGLGGSEEGDGVIKTAGAMPMIPGNQSESGRPPVQPMPGPLPPTSNPFGKRADAMPMIPGSQSESGIPPQQPMPGPLPPTDNPFGKRADAGGDGDSDDQGGVIDDEEAA